MMSLRLVSRRSLTTNAHQRLSRYVARRALASASDETLKYPHLFEPLELVNGVMLPNRVLMGSMHTGLEGNSIPGIGLWYLGEERHDLSAMAEYFRERAQGGCGLMVTGGIAPNWQGWVGT